MMFDKKAVYEAVKGNSDFINLCNGISDQETEQSTYNHLYNQVEEMLINEIDEVWDYITGKIEDTIAEKKSAENLAGARERLLAAIKEYNKYSEDDSAQISVKFKNSRPEQLRSWPSYLDFFFS